MAGLLPDLDLEHFAADLGSVSRLELTPETLESLWRHYRELRRWNPRLSLIGSGTVGDVLTRHYGESLEALPLLGLAGRLVDLGSGAGFPGLVLAAARPDLEAWLVEARHKKAVFLRSAAHRAELSTKVLNARVGALLPMDFPRDIDVVTLRALRLGPEEWSAVTARVGADGRILRWVGPREVRLPKGFRIGRRRALPGGKRTIEELVRE